MRILLASLFLLLSISVSDAGNVLSNASIRNTSIGATAPAHVYYALDFDGSDDHVNVPNGAGVDFNGSRAMSFEAWIYPDSIGETAGRIIDKIHATTAGYNIFLFTGNVVGVSLYEGATLRSSRSTATVTLGAWNHVVATWEHTEAPKIYINGVLSANSPTAAAATSSNDSANLLYIGSNVATDRSFNGKIRLVRIWYDRVLTPGDVSTLYNGGTFSWDVLYPTPSADFRFSEGTGTALDNLYSASSGTISGATWVSP